MKPFSVAAVMVTILSLAMMGDLASAQEKGQNRFFEMRTYITHPGRLDALNKRFREHTNRLFEKHGMTLIGFWTPVDGPEKENTLIYILAFPSREARDQAFKNFGQDPEWIEAKNASEKDGKIVMKVESKFMTPTDYSAIK